MKSNILAGLFPAQLQAPGPAKASEDPGSLLLGRMKSCSVTYPPFPSPLRRDQSLGRQEQAVQFKKGGILSPYQSQEVFGSEGIGTGRFLILGLSQHRVGSALIGTSPGEGADGAAPFRAALQPRQRQSLSVL